jgi:chromosome segregation ATPase
MFLRRNIRNVIGLAVMSLFLGSTVAFSQEMIPEYKNSFDLNASKEMKERLPNFPKRKEVYIPEEAIDLETIREKEENGLRLAKKAITMADPYPGSKAELSRKKKELNNLVERRKNLTATIQRLQIGLNRKKAELARKPKLLKVSVQQYTQKIMELKDELAGIEKRIPVLESNLAEVNLELQVEELVRGNLSSVEEDAGEFDEEFEEVVQERFNAGKILIN